jgi:exopolyphosphatase/guanosine-5'-triphosphate,3'-diphosphate pyrophosphatase
MGTNSTRLLIADVVDGRLVEVERLLRITRLGEDVDRGGVLVPAAMERVHAVLEEFRGVAAAHGAGRVLATATSAVRDAANGRDFLAEIERRHGFETRLLSGDEEALLTFRGITSTRPIDVDTLIVDIGGGSTELIAGSPGGVGFHVSTQMGCVRLTERHLHSDPPTAAELAACAADVRAILEAAVPPAVRKPGGGTTGSGNAPGSRAAIGVAGTVTTIAALDLGLAAYDAERIHGHAIPAAAVVRERERLGVLTVEQRRGVQGLEPARAPVIVAGTVILDEILRWFGLAAIEASERDILHGAALLAAETLPV